MQSTIAYFYRNFDKCRQSENWLKTPRPTIARCLETLPISEFIEEVNDLITLSTRKSLHTSNTYYKWMYQYTHVIKQNKEKILWGKQISDAICEQLSKVLTTLKFYMTSYLLYVAASMRHFPCLSILGNRNQVVMHKYYSQLTLKNSHNYFWRVNDVFFRYYMVMPNKNFYNRRVSDHACEVVNE